MNEYTVDIGGLEHTLQLSDEEAKARGLQPRTKEQKAPANKARKASSKKQG